MARTPGSKANGASGPISIAIAPHPPVEYGKISKGSAKRKRKKEMRRGWSLIRLGKRSGDYLMKIRI